jgi:septum formation protein
MDRACAPPSIYLASASPRRRQLLAQIGVQFELLPAPVDETPHADETPADFVCRMALDKAVCGQGNLRGRRRRPVLGADTVVVVENQIFGKPRDSVHALSMLRQMSAARHQVLSAVALVQEERSETRLQRSSVTFRPLAEEEMQRYWDSGEPADKAGAYAIQGFGAIFVRELEGSYSGVMGLPLYETWELLRRFDVIVDAALTSPAGTRSRDNHQ